MIIKYQTTYEGEIFTADELSVLSNCTTISFDNFGDEDINIYYDGGANYFTLKAGNSISLGGDKESKVTTSFKLDFAGGGDEPGVNVIRETIKMAGNDNN